MDISSVFSRLFAFVRDEVKSTTQHSLVKELYGFLGKMAEMFPDKCGEAESLKRLLLSTLDRCVAKQTIFGPADFNICRFVIVVTAVVVVELEYMRGESGRPILILAG